MTLAESFHALFSGLNRAHGEYRLTGKVNGKGKQDGRGITHRTPATVELWDQHLQGKYGVGIVPIRDDNKCRFAAIDIDKYDNDLKVLADQLVKLELPLIACRSKSGGAHLYLFCREAIPARLVRTRLMEWAVILGHPGVEVFPKQVTLAGTEDIGNWINMPYFGGAATDRYGVFSGEKLSPEQFIKIATMMAVDEDGLQTFQINTPAVVLDQFHEAPPCLQTLATKGFEEGGRNNALFDVAVYLRKRFGDDEFKSKLDEYNHEFMKPPLGAAEVVQVARNVGKKNYQYRCGEMPINQYCNRQICLTRRFGIGVQDGEPGVVFGGIVKIDTDPPSWIWDVNGLRISLSTMELKDQQRFHSRCIESINMWPNPLKPNDWRALVQEKLKEAEVIPAPPEASRGGQMWIHLESFLSNQPPARHREELLIGKPWFKDGRSYFTAGEFNKYLQRQRFVATEREIWGWLRDRDAQHHFFNLNGRGLNCWSIPSFSKQTAEFEVPSILDGEENEDTI